MTSKGSFSDCNKLPISSAALALMVGVEVPFTVGCSARNFSNVGRCRGATGRRAAPAAELSGACAADWLAVSGGLLPGLTACG